MHNQSIDQLFEACGATDPIQVTVTGPDQVVLQRNDLAFPFAMIGREEHADLCLPDPQVSRRHAYVQMIAGRLFVVDLRSREGTHWDGEHNGAGWIKNHHVVRIAPYALHLACDTSFADHTVSVVDNPLLVYSFADKTEPALALECKAGPSDRFVWRMRSVLALLGRRAVERGLTLDDPSVSGFHCSLLRTPLGVWVLDLLGEGGTVVNGQRVRWRRLEDGDELDVGQFRFHVLLTTAVAPSPLQRPSHTNWSAAGNATDGPPLRENGNVSEGSSAPRKSVTGSLVAVGSPPEKAVVTEDFLLSLFHQFASVQNQMFDQFQQAMNMMVDMFSDMQRQQVGLVRKEVDRLHQITEEIHAFQNQLVSGSSAPGTEPAKPPPRPRTTEPVRTSAPLRTGPVEPETSEKREGFSAAAAATSGAAGPVTQPPSMNLPAHGEDGDGEVHVWLYDKIAELQRERHGGLKRLFDFLRGK